MHRLQPQAGVSDHHSVARGDVNLEGFTGRVPSDESVSTVQTEPGQPQRILVSFGPRSEEKRVSSHSHGLTDRRGELRSRRRTHQQQTRGPKMTAHMKPNTTSLVCYSRQDGTGQRCQRGDQKHVGILLSGESAGCVCQHLLHKPGERHGLKLQPTF